jgi:hypothetical protein
MIIIIIIIVIIIMITIIIIIVIIITIIGESGCFYKNLAENDDTSSIKADYNPAQHYHHIPGGCKIANGLGFAVLISVLLTIAAVIARNKAIGEGESEEHGMISKSSL